MFRSFRIFQPLLQTVRNLVSGNDCGGRESARHNVFPVQRLQKGGGIFRFHDRFGEQLFRRRRIRFCHISEQPGRLFRRMPSNVMHAALPELFREPDRQSGSPRLDLQDVRSHLLRQRKQLLRMQRKTPRRLRNRLAEPPEVIPMPDSLFQNLQSAVHDQRQNIISIPRRNFQHLAAQCNLCSLPQSPPASFRRQFKGFIDDLCQQLRSGGFRGKNNESERKHQKSFPQNHFISSPAK